MVVVVMVDRGYVGVVVSKAMCNVRVEETA